MRQNFNLDKKRRDEAKRKKREEKKAKRLNQKAGLSAPEEQLPDQAAPASPEPNAIDPANP